jgi:hypothetical protein
MNPRNDLLEKGLRSIDPLAGEDVSRMSCGGEGLLASILASAPVGAIGPDRTRRRRALPQVRRSRLLVAVPVAAAGLLALIVGLPSESGGGAGTLPALARVAQAAADQAPTNTDLPYLYVKTQEDVTDMTVASSRTWSVYRPVVNEEWVARDGSGRVRTVEAAPRFVGPKDREEWEAAGRIDFLAHGWNSYTHEANVPAGHFRASLYDGVELSALPTDPAALAAWLQHRVKDSGENAGNGFPLSVKTLTLVAELLNDPLATPQLRAALYEAEGLVPGIEYLGQATDQLGRHGVAVGAESADSGVRTLYSLIFDPKTSQVLAYEQTPREAPAAAADEQTPTEAKLFIDSGSTGSLHSTP